MAEMGHSAPKQRSDSGIILDPSECSLAQKLKPTLSVRGEQLNCSASLECGSTKTIRRFVSYRTAHRFSSTLTGQPPDPSWNAGFHKILLIILTRFPMHVHPRPVATFCLQALNYLLRANALSSGGHTPRIASCTLFQFVLIYALDSELISNWLNIKKHKTLG